MNAIPFRPSVFPLQAATLIRYRRDTTSSVQAIPQQPIGSVYPNPSSGTVMVTLEKMPYYSQPEVVLVDVLGSIYQRTCVLDKKSTDGEHRVSFSVSDLPNGVYIGRITNCASCTSFRVVVAK